MKQTTPTGEHSGLGAEAWALAVCFGLALAAHAWLVPVMAAVLRGPGSAGVEGVEVVWEPGAAEVEAGQTLPLALRLRPAGAGTGAGPTAVEGPVEVRVQWSRGGRWDDKAADVAAARGGEVVGGAVAMPWDAGPEHAGPGWLLARARRAGGAWSRPAARVMWVEAASATPEVVVAAVRAPDTVAAGGVLSMGFTLANHGRGWARGGVTDRVVLRPQKEGVGGAQPWTVASVARRDPLAPQQRVSAAPAAVRLPVMVVPGRYELVVMPGAGTPRSWPVRVHPPLHADLAVAEIDSPPTVRAGEAFALRFVVTNQSPVPTGPGLWGDRVYLSVDDVLDPGDVMLRSEPRVSALVGFGAYASLEHSVTLDPADAVSSRMHLIVSADDAGDLDEGAFEDNNTLARAITVIHPADADEPDTEVKLGREDEPADRVRVAWIAYDDFQELQARRSVTHQPAVQARVEPTADAPLRSDASPDRAGPEQVGVVSVAAPPAPLPSPAPLPPTRPEALPAVAATPPAGPVGAPASGGTAEAAGVVSESASPASTDTLEPQVEEQENDPPPLTPVAPPDPPVPPVLAASPVRPPPVPEVVSTTPATTPEPTPEPRPTSTPESDREADPTAPVTASVIRPGTVRVGPGLEVRTVRPRFSVTARTLSVPRNPEVVLTFGADGKVRLAELRTSTGFDNIDGPLLSSLYAWTAKGPRLAEESEVRVSLTVLFREPATPAEKSGDDAAR